MSIVKYDYEIESYLHCVDCSDSPYVILRKPLLNPVTGEQSAAFQNVVVPASAGQSECDDPSNPICPYCKSSLVRK